MDIDSLKALLSDFDLAKFLPDLTSTLGKVELILRIAVLAGPLILLVLGLLYLFAPAKEANYTFGFRTFWGMSSVESWLFTQRLAGIVWGGLGLVLTVVMAVVCNGYRGMELVPMLGSAVLCILWEIGLTVMSWLCIAVTVVFFFDRKGVRRKKNTK